MPQTIKAEKGDGKNGVICLGSIFISTVMILKLSKNMHFLQFCANLSKKPQYTKATYIFASESTRCALSKNGIVYYVITVRRY